MKAAVFEKEGVLKIKDVNKPEIMKADDMILEVELCSVCGTDVHIMNVPPGYTATPGTILGHELVGKVVEVGSGVTCFELGDRVVLNPNDYCGVCRYCQLNLPNQCENIIAMGIAADGGFAEFVRVSERCAHKIPSGMPAETAAFAEPLACAINATRKIKVNPCESVVVIGAGPIGMLFIQLMKAAGAAPIISLELNEQRRKFALECGADFAIDPSRVDAPGFVASKTDGLGADYAIDVVGSQMMMGINCIRKGGSVLLFGNNAKAKPEVTQSQITYKEARVLGSWLANASFPQAVKLLSSGKLKLDFLVTHTFSIDDTEKAIDALRSGEGIEVMVNPKL